MEIMAHDVHGYPVQEIMEGEKEKPGQYLYALKCQNIRYFLYESTIVDIEIREKQEAKYE